MILLSESTLTFALYVFAASVLDNTNTVFDCPIGIDKGIVFFWSVSSVKLYFQNTLLAFAFPMFFIVNDSDIGLFWGIVAVLGYWTIKEENVRSGLLHWLFVQPAGQIMPAPHSKQASAS